MPKQERYILIQFGSDGEMIGISSPIRFSSVHEAREFADEATQEIKRGSNPKHPAMIQTYAVPVDEYWPIGAPKAKKIYKEMTPEPKNDYPMWHLAVYVVNPNGSRTIYEQHQVQKTQIHQTWEIILTVVFANWQW